MEGQIMRLIGILAMITMAAACGANDADGGDDQGRERDRGAGIGAAVVFGAAALLLAAVVLGRRFRSHAHPAGIAQG